MERTLKDVQEHPIFKALDPMGKRFLQARRLPPSLNPYHDRGAIIAALISYSRFPHIKTVPTLQMMLEDFEKGFYEGKHTLVVPSSGNTAHAAVLLAPAFGFRRVKAVMSTDVPSSKTGILRAFGTQVDVIQTSDTAATALDLGEAPGHHHLDQYSHMGNVHAHRRYTGPAIVEALGTVPDIIAIVMGSGGTVAGVGQYLQKEGRTVVLGVRPILGEQVPGARDRKKMERVVKLPWKEVVDEEVEITRKDAFIAARKLWSAVVPQPGPTSGMAWAGLMKYLQRLDEREIRRLAGRTAAFICPDDGRFYSDVMLAELDPDQGVPAFD